MAAYYNESNKHAAEWLRNLAAAGLICPGDVDDRDIRDICANDLKSYTQHHFFAGIGGWAYAARLAGWPDDRAVWTGSCPCQPWSIAGRGDGAADERHLWPEFARLIGSARPSVIMGEQVADAAGKGWLDEVAVDLAEFGYAFRPVILPAVAIGSFHRRDRIFFVADAGSERLPGAEQSERRESIQPTAEVREATAQRDRLSPWRNYRQQRGHDRIARMVKPGVRLLAHGIPARLGVLGALGNAIVPQLGAEVMAAYLEAYP